MDVLNVFKSVATPLALAFLVWATATVYWRFYTWKHGRKIFRWLEANTQDEPHESHKSLLEICDGTRLSEDQVRLACRQNRRILQSLTKPGYYSIRQKESQSVYEKRGLLSLGD